MNGSRQWRVEMMKDSAGTYGRKTGWFARLYAPGMLIGAPCFREVFAYTKADCRRKAKEAIALIESEQRDRPDTFYVKV